MRVVYLTKGQHTWVDEEVYWRLHRYRWKAQWSETSKSYYASRSIWRPEKKECDTVLMHREILGLSKGDKRQVDHKNHDTLDNRRINLVITDHSGNALNNNRRGYTLHKPSGKFHSKLQIKGKVYSLGYHDTEIKAHLAYLAARTAHIK